MTPIEKQIAEVLGVQPKPCVGMVWTAAVQAYRPCPEPATHAVLRTCHGTENVHLVCTRHAGKIAKNAPTWCCQCRADTAAVVAMSTIGGAA
jgi:hypothetical protein